VPTSTTADPRQRARAATIGLAGAGLLLALWQLRPAVPNATCAPDVAIVRGCALLAWAIAGYLTLTITAAALCRVRTSARSVHVDRLLPPVVRRRVDTAIRVGVVCAVLGIPGLPTAAFAGPTPTAAVVAHCTSDTSSAVHGADDPLDWPGLANSPTASSPTASATTRSPGPDVGLVTAGRQSHSTSPSAHRTVAGTHVVEDGDTLWSIARATLPAPESAADITAEWHRWYAANRVVIGADPDLIRPGQDLRRPTSGLFAANPAASDPRSPQ
jgi:hypothetical protein